MAGGGTGGGLNLLVNILQIALLGGSLVFLFQADSTAWFAGHAHNPGYGGGYPPQHGGGYPPQQGGGYPPQEGGGYPPQGGGDQR